MPCAAAGWQRCTARERQAGATAMAGAAPLSARASTESPIHGRAGLSTLRALNMPPDRLPCSSQFSLQLRLFLGAVAALALAVSRCLALLVLVCELSHIERGTVIHSGSAVPSHVNAKGSMKGSCWTSSFLGWMNALFAAKLGSRTWAVGRACF